MPAHDDLPTERSPTAPPLGRLLARGRGGREAPLPASDGGHLGPRREGTAAGAPRHRHAGAAPFPAAGRPPVQRAGPRLAHRFRRARVPLHGGHPGPPAPLRSPARYFLNQSQTRSHHRPIWSVTPPCSSHGGGSVPFRKTSVTTTGQ